jgi:hypothetical protein
MPISGPGLRKGEGEMLAVGLASRRRRRRGHVTHNVAKRLFASSGAAGVGVVGLLPLPASAPKPI